MGRSKVGGDKIQVLLGEGVGPRIDKVSSSRGEFVRLAVLAALEVAEGGKRPVTPKAVEKALERGQDVGGGVKGQPKVRRVMGSQRRDDAEAAWSALERRQGGTEAMLVEDLGWLPMRVQSAVRLLMSEGRVVCPRPGWMQAVGDE